MYPNNICNSPEDQGHGFEVFFQKKKKNLKRYRLVEYRQEYSIKVNSFIKSAAGDYGSGRSGHIIK